MHNDTTQWSGADAAGSCNTFLAYWNTRRVAMAARGSALVEMSSSQLGRIGVGDRIWIVGPGTSTNLTLIGHIDVAEKHDDDVRRAFVEAMDGGVATSRSRRCTVFAHPKHPCRAARVELAAQLWRQLRFWTGRSQIAVAANGKPDARYSLQTVRRLTGDSAALLARAWATAP